MRISDWSSDVCSSDLGHRQQREAEDGREERKYPDTDDPEPVILEIGEPFPATASGTGGVGGPGIEAPAQDAHIGVDKWAFAMLLRTLRGQKIRREHRRDQERDREAHPHERKSTRLNSR